ncbi:hypothetical protein VHEMI10604 [[Torrubiella] hemipterigena]|uniref:Peptidase C15, pyroglutamyl peptidase I-like protein n=1 Tax=[Torrubiella] hemipterigena TaxID=1531966 RepID=A0A0A1TSH4_9HYPO|nr:hypothetical protein VHEMI10604 [[Torrubiella] hemipterigena]
MGSQTDNKEEFTILVTGFGPFREQYPVNPSWEIAKGLPEYLPTVSAKVPKSRFAVDLPPVRILVHPEAIHVGYDNVRSLTPKFWDGNEYMGHKIDAAIHIGMAGPELQYKIERRAHRTGYDKKDVDGLLLKDETEGKLDENWIWHGLPDELLSELDIEDIHMRWQGNSPVYSVAA